MEKYEFEDGMRKISGFSDDYENACRTMLKTGLEWFDKHPDAEPLYKGFKNIYGVIIQDNEDAKTLSKVVTDAVDDCTGAMHQAVISHILWIKGNSWEEYVIQMKSIK